MGIMVDDDDIKMRGRIERAFKNRDNAEWSKDYFAKYTHAEHADPVERARHERHVEAVQQLQDELGREEAARQYRAGLAGTYASPDAMRLEIEKTRSHPSYMDKHHKDHQATVDHVSYLYRQLYR